MTRLSMSALNSFNRCARCFWLEKNDKLRQPEGIKAGVPIGIDRVVKDHYDSHRPDLPPELEGKVLGGLYPGDRMPLGKLRNWQSGLRAHVAGIELITAMDDLLWRPGANIYNVIDAKSKGKETDVLETEKYYAMQGDVYDYVLNANKYPTDGACFFAYYRPTGFDRKGMTWDVQVFQIQADHDRLMRVIYAAVECLGGPIPDGACEQCLYVQARGGR